MIIGLFFTGIICFLIGIATGSSGKASEQERVHEAFSLITKLKIEKDDLATKLEKANQRIEDYEREHPEYL